MNKEHFFPVWLVERTGTVRDGISWGGRDGVSALNATLPLCERCNSDFGREIESPMSRVFDDIEARKGLSDNEAELVVRWMWKFEGLWWVFTHPRHVYTVKYTLRERILRPIDDIRGQLTLAISLAETRDPDFSEGSLGIDSLNIHNAISVAGVFSRVAIVVCLSAFEDEVPGVFSKYQLAPKRQTDTGDAKLFYPAVGFPTCTDAVALLRALGPRLSSLHDGLGNQWRKQLANKRGNNAS
ncbi:MAG TPA: hypothetical protein VHE58_07045 [Burkholderiales bacterium]|nr:hypothetical protein [Burkholderiales bacterium]